MLYLISGFLCKLSFEVRCPRSDPCRISPPFKKVAQNFLKGGFLCFFGLDCWEYDFLFSLISPDSVDIEDGLYLSDAEEDLVPVTDDGAGYIFDDDC